MHTREIPLKSFSALAFKRIVNLQKRQYVTCNFCKNNHAHFSKKPPSTSSSTSRSNSRTFPQGVLFKRHLSGSSTTAEVDVEKLYPLRFVYVRTSTDVWEDFPQGVNFDVGYVDSGSKNNNDTAPVILGIPSSVGTHEELTRSLMIFSKLGYRVVIPNLPDSQFCRACTRSDGTVFEQSVVERADFINDFLQELKITKVDMAVVNACSVYCGVNLTAANKDLIRSLVLVNPTGLDYTQDMQPVRFHKTFGHTWDDRFMLQPLFGAFVNLGKLFTKKRHWPTCNVITYSRLIRALSLSDGKRDADSSHLLDALQLKSSGVPLYAIYGEDTSGFNQASSESYLEILGLPKSAIDLYDCEQKKTISKGCRSGKNTGVFIQGQPADLSQWNLPFVRKILLNYFKEVRPDL